MCDIEKKSLPRKQPLDIKATPMKYKMDIYLDIYLLRNVWLVLNSIIITKNDFQHFFNSKKLGIYKPSLVPIM